MKNNILKVFVLFVFFCAITPAFALPPAGPGSNNEYSGPSGGDDFTLEGASAAEQSGADQPFDPIDSNMLLLAGAGVLVAGYFFNRNKVIKA
jgi:hypothetical protein